MARYFSISFYKSETYNFLVERIRKPCDAINERKYELWPLLDLASNSFTLLYSTIYHQYHILRTTLGLENKTNKIGAILILVPLTA